MSSEDGLVPYKEFLRRFQDRSDQGMPHKILANPLHRLVCGQRAVRGASSISFLFIKMAAANQPCERSLPA